MKNKPEWSAKLALGCYIALIGGILMSSIVMELVLFGIGIDLLDLPFSITLIASPVNETVILGVTLLFARHKGAGLKELGLKKVSLRILAIVAVLAVPLFLLGAGISVGEEIILGPDPLGELSARLVMPRDSIQLIALIAISLVLVGPCEELAFRGFVQKGFENSFGKLKGLLIASILFGCHMVLIRHMRLYQLLLLVWFLAMFGGRPVEILLLRL
jgi:membrane protease YdiL (CAAX protease family)